MRRALRSLFLASALWPGLALAQTPLPNPIILPPNTIVGRGNLGSSGYPYAMSFQEFVSTLSSLGISTAAGTASGDLSGSYPNPTVAKINGVAPPNSGLWKGNGSGGAVAAVSGTDYAPATSGTSILKAAGGGFANAVAGTDFAPVTTGTSVLKGNGSGGFSSAIAGTDYQAVITQTGALKGTGSGNLAQAACADLSNAAASCSTDATNANNISSGTLPPARLGGLSALTASLGADVALNNASNYFDGPSIAQGTTGTWWVSGNVTLVDTAGAATFVCKLWDGTTIIDSAPQFAGSANANVTVALSGYLASPAGNIKISCKDPNSTSGNLKFNASGSGKDSTISAHRIN